MRPQFAAVRSGLIITCLSGSLFACSDSSGPGPSPESIQAVGTTSYQATVGQTVSPAPGVKVLDTDGEPLKNVDVTFAVTQGGGSVTGGEARTNEDGVATVGSWTLGTVPGTNTLVAQVEGLSSVQFTASAAVGPAVKLAFSQQPSQSSIGCEMTPAVKVDVQDQYGNRITASGVLIGIALGANPGGSTLGGAAPTNAQGGTATFGTLVVSNAANGYTLVASSSGLTSATSQAFSVASPAQCPALTTIQPAIISSGATVTINGSGFAATPGANQVTINGVAATVTGGNQTQLTVQAPQFPNDCLETRNVDVRVTAGGQTGLRAHPARTAQQISLNVGESILLTTPQTARCAELPLTSGRYLVSVYNVDQSTFTPSGPIVGTVSQVAYSLAGKQSSIPQGSVVAAARSPQIAARAQRATRNPAPAIDRRAAQLFRQRRSEADAEHARILEFNENILRTAPRTRATARAGGALANLAVPPAAVPATVGGLGALTEFRYSITSCNSFATITARTAWVGQHAIIAEDIASFGNPPLNGTLDARYAEIGAEFDAVMHDIIVQNFGDPLLVDAGMGNHGKIIMLFTPQVNNSSAQAFVYSCDFFPRSTFSKSNEAPVFYSRVPTQPVGDFTPNTVNGWQWVTRSTVIHETKHIASYATRAQTAQFEQGWLEEGSARLAEELYGRIQYGTSWKDNSNYASTLVCDVRPDVPQCADHAYVMPKHFDALYDFLNSSETQTPFGDAAGNSSFYGSSWALQRWIVDHYGSTEPAFLTALTHVSGGSGALNLAARTGRPFAELLGEWSLALAVDDRPGVAPANPRLSIPSWDTRDVFLGMHNDFPDQSGFPKEHPLTTRPITYGSFTSELRAVANGGFTMWELSGAQSGSQLIALQGVSGGAPSANLSMAILRIE